MKFLKKWLFPALTCLIVMGAAVLPARVSQARDAGQFGQIHTEALDADALPVVSTPTLLDRMEMWAGYYSSEHPILSYDRTVFFDDPEEARLMQSAQDLLIEADVLPERLFETESIGAVQYLLWDPETGDAFQAPSAFWRFSWTHYSDKSHQKDIVVAVDAETGLPIYLHVYDTDMSQWLPYQEEDLRELAERFFGLLDLDTQEIRPSSASIRSFLRYSIEGGPMRFLVSRSPTVLTIELDQNWRNRTDSDGVPFAYDR